MKRLYRVGSSTPHPLSLRHHSLRECPHPAATPTRGREGHSRCLDPPQPGAPGTWSQLRPFQALLPSSGVPAALPAPWGMLGKWAGCPLPARTRMKTPGDLLPVFLAGGCPQCALPPTSPPPSFGSWLTVSSCLFLPPTLVSNGTCPGQQLLGPHLQEPLPDFRGFDEFKKLLICGFSSLFSVRWVGTWGLKVRCQ